MPSSIDCPVYGCGEHVPIDGFVTHLQLEHRYPEHRAKETAKEVYP